MQRIKHQKYDGTYLHFNNVEWPGGLGDAMFVMNYIYYRQGPFFIHNHNNNYFRHYPGLIDYYPDSMAKVQAEPVPGNLAHEITCCRFTNWLYEQRKPIVQIFPKKEIVKDPNKFKVVIAQREKKGTNSDDLMKYVPDNATQVINVANKRDAGIDWLVNEIASADLYIGSCTGPTWVAASLRTPAKMVAWESSDMKFVNNVRNWFDIQENCEWIKIGQRPGKGGNKEDCEADKEVFKPVP